jgi:hypothetical protein
MSKIPITREELTKKVLAAIRQHPGCLSLSEIAITPVDVLDVGATWHVNIIDSGDVEMELAYATARSVQESLSPLFEVTD